MFSFRLMLVRLVLVAVFLLFVGALAFYQLLHGAELRDASEQNHLRWVRSPAPRGLILDRKGRVLATNAEALSAWLVPGEVPRKGWNQLLSGLVDLGIYPDLAAARDALGDVRRYPTYLPVRLQSDLNIAMISRIEEDLAFLPGVYLKPEPVRRYPDGPLAAHLLGYLREIDAQELAEKKEDGYHAGDRTGRSGLERAFEDNLRGTEGGEQVEVDAHGRVIRTLQTVAPQAGAPLSLTIDLDIQRVAEEALHGRPGAIIALDPATGDILAMTSAPAYDLNLMSGRINRTLLSWLQGTSRPELNRVTSGLYPPGSVFKIITAATALEKGVISPGDTFYCDGVYHGIHCWKHTGHGALNLTEALAQSCNVAFMKIAERCDIIPLSDMATRFGLGQPTGIDVVPEKNGVVPNPIWAHKVYHRRWELGETLQVGIGQSALEVTPLQCARLIAAIANGGKLVTPRVVSSIGTTAQPGDPPTLLELHAETLRRIIEGLKAVTGEGTAKSMDPSLHIAAKTGTAQNSQGDDHSWFVGFAPVEAPKIAVAVLVEHGGHGGAVAAPIAEAIIRMALQGPKSHKDNTAKQLNR